MNLTAQLKQPLIARIAAEAGELDRLDDEAVRRLITTEVSRLAQGRRVSLRERRELIESLFRTMRGLDILQPLVDDPAITEIMVNGSDSIYIERAGRLERTDLAFDDRDHLTQVITRFFGRANRLINEQKPMADLRLADGSRVHAVLPPAAPEGPVLSIRRFTGIRPDVRALVENRALTPEAAAFLESCVQKRKNLFVSGGTGTGKTTLLNALGAFIPVEERVVTIEDARELNLAGLKNVVRLEARQSGPDGKGQITLSDLIRSSLRLRPDRIVVGEVRGAEAYDMLQAMQTGHPGSMSTGHGNSAELMLERLSLMLLTASTLPWEACRRLIASSLDFLIHLKRRPDGVREVADILAMTGYEEGAFQLCPVFRRDDAGELNRVS